MSKARAAVQLGMLGVASKLEDTHVVAAHTRVLASGEEVFVGEHVRWNRGRSERPSSSPRRRSEPADEQLSLWAMASGERP